MSSDPQRKSGEPRSGSNFIWYLLAAGLILVTGFYLVWNQRIHQLSWTDFNQQEQKSFSSDNDSDDEDEEINKICFQIKPISATTVSVEELQRAAASLHLQYTWNMVSQQIDLHYN